MSKSKIIREMRSYPGITNNAEAERAFAAFVDGLKDVIAIDGEASIPGLGKFKVKRREARAGRNPHTGESLTIAAKDVLTFKEAKTA